MRFPIRIIADLLTKCKAGLKAIVASVLATNVKPTLEVFKLLTLQVVAGLIVAVIVGFIFV